MGKQAIPPANLALAEYTDSLNRLPTKEELAILVDIVGSDRTRMIAVQYSLFLHELWQTEDTEAFWKCWGYLHRMDLHDAHRIFGFLPDPVYVDRSEKTQLTLKHMYVGVHCWLLSRAQEQPTAAKLLEELFGSLYSTYARLAELRYDLINRLVELKLLPGFFSKPAWPWLLAETAEAFQHVTTKGRPSKRTSYDAEKDYQDYLEEWAINPRWEEVVPSKNIIVVDLCDIGWVYHFHNLVDAIAQLRSDKDSEFERLFFRPYKAARKEWKRKANNPNIRDARLPQRRAGRLPGT